jgi:hypothetical protein
MSKPISILIWLACILLPSFPEAQDSLPRLPEEYFSRTSSRINALEDKLDKHSAKVLARIQKEDVKIWRKLSRIDSLKAKEFLAATQRQYQALQEQLKTPGSFTGYIPFLDTLKTSVAYLGANSGMQNPALPAQVDEALKKIQGLERELQQAESIKAFIAERKQYVKTHLDGLGFTKELQKLNKQAYYYAAQVREYKELLKDPSKMERKALELLSKTKAFQDFMKKNSQLASLFRLPGSEPSTASLQGLQTRAQVNALIQERIGSGGSNAEAVLRENIQSAQAQLSQLKDRAAALGQGSIGSAGDGELPDFKPNSQKTKSFRQRLELGTNLQTQKGNHYFPITSDVGLSLGYKINDKSIIGLGASYKLGLGTGWNHIAVSHQGMGLRSFIDLKLKGSLYASGGYEQNYRSEFRSFDVLKDYSAWQSSGLIGLSKKYQVSKKFKGDMKLLWDFLSYRQVPRTQAVLFRIGYSLK